MNEREFANVMETCRGKSGNDLKAYLTQFEDDPVAVSLLTGTEFDDIGLARTSCRQAATEVWPDLEDNEGSLTESLQQFDTDDGVTNGYPIGQLYMDLQMLDSKSGDDQKEFLEDMFIDYAYPSVVSFAVLNDMSLGFGDSTLAKAFGVKDSLPFYESVVDIVRDEEPRTSPEVGKPFKPMKAVPESRGKPDNPVGQLKVDGYRALVHISGQASNQEVRVFSRRMNNISESLPEFQEVDWPSGDYILDGEVIAKTGSYSDTSKRIGRSSENVERDIEMNYAAFDAIVFDGEDISNERYADRYSKMRTVVHKADDERVYGLGFRASIENAKNDAIENGDEGIIVKNLDAPYEFDKRSAHWQKQKFDSETIDVVVTDIEEGTGKASGTMGKLTIESADGVPLGKTGSGFSDAERDAIWNNQDEWIGRTIEVEARGLGTGGNSGQPKLRMPIYKRDRLDDGEPDSWDRIHEIMPDV